MENESQNDNLIVNPYFPILYPDQKFKNSIEYKKWKKSKAEIMGENGVEMHCNKDKIVIYENINENLKCPICKEEYSYCPYCKRAEKLKSCCMRGFIHDIFNNENYYKYINSEDEYKKKEFIEFFLILFIPFVLNISLYFTIFFVSYLDLIKNDIILYDKISNKKLDMCHKILILGFMLLMSLIYLIFFYSIFLFIIIFSIPFKLYPIKFYIGILENINFF